MMWNPFDPERCIGTIIEIGPTYVKANMPTAASLRGLSHHGYQIGAGIVGEFVTIEAEGLAVFGKIVSIKLPERERLEVEGEKFDSQTTHPLGTIQLLSSVQLSTRTVVAGVTSYPRLGSRVFSAHPSFVRAVLEGSGRAEERFSIEIAALPDDKTASIHFTPEQLFGRHCGILGSTGGGKSWTLASIVERVAKYNSKVILLDATGEYYTLKSRVIHAHIGGNDDASPSIEVCTPYTNFTETDMIALFRPSGQTQGPKLRLAMKSLKLAKLVPELASNGVIIKANRVREPYDSAYQTHYERVESQYADFDVTKLAAQIVAECIWPFDRVDVKKFGGAADNEMGFCITLVTRIQEMVESDHLSCIFKPGSRRSVFECIDEFLEDEKHSVLRISLKGVPFAHNAREIVANAIGRHLLQIARDGNLEAAPLLVCVDEAHQFLNKVLGDENNRYPLDSFDQIAKEGRKFGLSICIATQRPRDLPEGVLSQMGTLIVHRLTNDRDREIVERASGEIDRSAAAFLPSLTPGQAVIVGAEFAMPVTIQILPPTTPPDSSGPDFQKYWR